MIFLSGKKIDCEIDAEHCHFILDSSNDWDDFRKSHPIAFCVGAKRAEVEDYATAFENIGFRLVRGSGSSNVTAFIARNTVFIREFEEKTPMALAASGQTNSD